jgi:hypothetical protein
MLATLLWLTMAAFVLALVLLGIVVAGIRRESCTARMSSRPPSMLAGLVRRLLGVGVRRPTPPAASVEDQYAAAGTSHRPDDEGW